VLRLIYSNRTEALVTALAGRLPSDPFVETRIVVPNRAMERVVELGLATRRGMVANVRFERLESFLAGELEAQAAATGAPRRFLRAGELEARILSVLSGPEPGPSDELAPLARYLMAVGAPVSWSSPLVDRRRLDLVPRLAQLFQEYTFSRPDWIRAWMDQSGSATSAGPDGELATWQRALYRRARELVVMGADGALDTVPRTTLAEELEREGGWSGGEPVLVFGVSYVARAFQLALATLARARDVELFTLNPCREFWADVETGAEARARARRERATEEDPHGLLVANESELLRAWGRPGREHVSMLDEASGFDAEDRFVDPVERWRLASPAERSESEAPALLRVQASVLERRPVASGPEDASLVVLPCTSIRREVESVAQLVWGLLAEGERVGRPLRLPEIAILVQPGARESYLPHLEAVLGEPRSEEAQHLPWSAQDLQLASRSRVAEAALRLLAFFGAEPTRRALLGLLAHPLLRPEGADDDASVWVALAERVGIVRGVDEADLRGTYADGASGEGRVLHFDQGLRRLALGCAAGDVDEELPGGLAPARVAGRGPETLAFLTLCRSLLADHRALGRAHLSLASWAELLDRVIAAYVRPEARGESAELERCRSALRGLAELDVDRRPHRVELALSLAERALEGIAAVRGEPQSLGLVVASLLPMRAIPFRVVFVLGLGEGLFPQQRSEVGLDLRAARRRSGDVAPDERDRYAFLETLLSTRERLFLSYVARDEHTGDPIAPSSVVTELAEACGGLLTCTPPHRRHEAVELEWARGIVQDASSRAVMARALPAALSERTVRARGDAERAHFRGIELASEALAQLAVEDPRRVELSIPALPGSSTPGPGPGLGSSGVGQRGVDQEATRVGLDVLGHFLRCPIQGRAAQWLRGGWDHEREAAAVVADEPLDAEVGSLRGLARAALASALEEGLSEAPFATLSRAVERELREARGRGRLPVGVLGVEARAEAERVAEGWLETLLDARPGTRRARAVRFGSVSSDRAAAEARLEALGPIQLGSLPSGAGAVSVEGRTRPFLRDEGDGRGELVVLVSGPPGSSDRARVARLGSALECYLDHVALAAAGHDRVARRALLLCSDGAYEAPLAPVGREVATRWLAGLADEILRTTPGFLPVEAVLLEEEAMRRGDPRLGERLSRAIEVVRTKWEGGSSRFGPIREATRHDAPEARELVRIVARRYAPFFQHVRPPVRAGANVEREGLLR
jgi:exodeoxyribonuclease V gamma subunit